MPFVGTPSWVTIQIEPVGQSFNIGEVSLGTIRMKSAGTGSVSEIGVVLGKTSVGGDADGNGVAEIGATFAMSDLQALFSNLSGSTSAFSNELSGAGLGHGSFGPGTFRTQSNVALPELNFRGIAGRGSRTLTPSRARDFESRASAIPPLRLGRGDILGRSNRDASKPRRLEDGHCSTNPANRNAAS